MTLGIAFAGLAWIVVGVMQLVLDHVDMFTIMLQVLPYVLLTFGEVLVATMDLNSLTARHRCRSRERSWRFGIYR
jgi:POT family proton-dependent oligopeptide transporter